MKSLRVLIVEDEPLFSELLRQSLAAEPGLEVVGITPEGEAAVRLAAELQADVVLMDIHLRGKLDGIEAALRIKEQRPQTGMVILSAHKDRRYVSSLPLERSRGWAYLLKQTVADVASVVRAIQGSASGMLVLDPEIVAGLRPQQGSALARLTPRQLEVLSLIAQGYNNAAIAQRLVLTEKSVETYINAIYQQLQLTGEQEIHARVKATLLYLEESQGRL